MTTHTTEEPMTAKFYQVGGSVRDEFLGLRSKDIDYSVEAESYAAMRQAILDRGGDIFLETPKYFTIRAKIPGLGACDYVLCRKDGAYSDGRHPETVEVGSIYDDLARRDFTMNAIARAEDGTIIDPFDGRTDIEQRLIRCVGTAKARFTEDGLRMLRAIRFSVTKNFRIADDIVTCIRHEDFFETRMWGVSDERIREELHKMFQHDSDYSFSLLGTFPEFRHFLLRGKLWLKPTLEAR